MLSVLQADIIKKLYQIYKNHEELINTLQLHSIDQKFGDIALNVGYLLCKATGESIAEVNSKISTVLQTLPWVKSIEIMSGFINIRLTESYYRDLAIEIAQQPDTYGYKAKNNTVINFDFASMNPTGPMHAGHLSSAILSDTLSNIFTSQGYTVQREYYINDTGGQIERLVKAVYRRYAELFGIHTDEDKEYIGEYLIPVAESLKAEHGDKWLHRDFDEYYEIFRSAAVTMLLDDIKHDLADLGIQHDIYFSEHQMSKSGDIQKAYALLCEKGMVTKQILERPTDWKGEYIPIEINGIELDNQFRPLFKRDGSHTYLMGDIANHLNRANRANWILDCFGADHFEHANMLKDIMTRLCVQEQSAGDNTNAVCEQDISTRTHAEIAQKQTIDNSQAQISQLNAIQNKFDIKLCQMVKFQKHGKAVTFSKRAGTYVTVRDILDTVGKDAIRLTMLSRKSSVHFIADLTQMMRVDDNNPVFYIQYAYARCCSAIARVNMDELGDKINIINEQTLCDEFIQEKHVRNLLNKMLFWPQMLEQCMSTLEPHTLLAYVQDLAKTFHSIWYHGTIIPILQLTREQNGYYPGMILCNIFKNMFGVGLKLLNVTALESMGRNNNIHEAAENTSENI